MTDALRVGFIGFGEAAQTFARGLQLAVGGLTAFCSGSRHRPPYSAAFRETAAGLGVTLVDSLGALARDASVLVSAVSPQAATAVAREIAPSLTPGHLFVDLNAVTPDTKGAVADTIGATGARFVDAELMGAASIYGFAVPLYVSGDGATAFRDLFRPLGLNVTVVPGAATAAALLKMFRSVVTKGMEAVIVEALLAAFRAGVPREAFAAVTEPMDAVRFSDFARMCVTSDPVHAGRRAEEMAGAVGVLRGLGVEPIMTEATRRRLERSAALGLRDAVGRTPGADYLDILALYDETERARRDGAVSEERSR